MHFPQTPPDARDVLQSMLAKSHDNAARLFAWRTLVDRKGRYLHWDELRRVEPPPEGFTHEEWWAAVRLARNQSEQALPLIDIQGRPFRFCEPNSLKAALRYLDMNAGGALRADARGLSSGEGRVHLTSSLAEEPFASAYIEGAATTRRVAKKLIFEGQPPRSPSELMVLNNFHAMEFIKTRQEQSLNLNFVLELHKIVTQGTLGSTADAGRIRTKNDVQVVDESNGEPLFQPPDWQQLPDRIDRLIAFVNDTNSSEEWIHPLLKAMVIHFMLAYEHPFVDGNGRVARALFYWYALKSGYWLLEYASISTIIADSKVGYGRSFLFVETDGADMTYFLDSQAKVAQKAVESLHHYVDRRREEVASLETRVFDWKRSDAFNRRQAVLINAFLRERVSQMTIVDHQQQHGVSYLTARADLESLLSKGYLTKGKRGAVSIYRPIKHLMTRLQSDT